MADIAVQEVTEAGQTITFTAAAGGGDTMNWDSQLILLIKNDSGGSITVTIAKQSSTTKTDPNVGLVTKADASVAVGAGAIGMIGPFKREGFRDSATGKIDITYSGVTSLTVAGITKTS